MHGSLCRAYGVAEEFFVPGVEAATCLHWHAEVVAAIEYFLLLVHLSTSCCLFQTVLVLRIFRC